MSISSIEASGILNPDYKVKLELDLHLMPDYIIGIYDYIEAGADFACYEFNSVTQLICYMKALLFNRAIADDVVLSNHASYDYWRIMTNITHNKEPWIKFGYELATIGNFIKFRDNPNPLLKTKGSFITLSNDDKFMGTRVNQRSSSRQGLNLMGLSLMRARVMVENYQAITMADSYLQGIIEQDSKRLDL